MTLFADLVEVSDAVSQTGSRLEKTELLAGFLARLEPHEVHAAVSFLSNRLVPGPLGVGYATVRDLDSAPADRPGLGIADIEAAFVALAPVTGSGSKAARKAILDDLWGRATAAEQSFLAGLILRNLRQGALEGVMADAVARALGVSVDRVRRAAMLEGDLAAVTVKGLVDGPDALGSATLAVMTPVQPMLAKTAASAAAAVETIDGEALVERKLDGLRLQVHRRGDSIAVFTRNLRNVTGELPGVVAAARRLGLDEVILDGEGLLVDGRGVPRSFQDSMSGDRGEIGGFFFDILYLDGEELIDRPLSERHQHLERVVPEEDRVASVLTADPTEAEDFFAATVGAGYEGVVVKDPSQPYEAGRRGTGWLKVKPTHTLDLVILAAEWGSGRRQGYLSNLHLGARGPDGGFVMLGKTFKGLTDEMLAWQTQRFLAIEESRSGHIVYLRPEIVYEIAFDGVQRSTRYPGGVALRFARVKGYRDDKGPDADTLEQVRAFLR